MTQPTSVISNLQHFTDLTNKAISNRKLNGQCFNHSYLMYPNIFNRSVFYVYINDNDYSIRPFNNTVVSCEKYTE